MTARLHERTQCYTARWQMPAELTAPASCDGATCPTPACPAPLVCLAGLYPAASETHRRVVDCLTRAAERHKRASGAAAPGAVRFSLVPFDHEFPTAKPARTTFDFCTPRGILKAGWMHKHVYQLPAVVVVFFQLDWSTADWPAQRDLCQQRLHALRAALNSQSTRLLVVLLQSTAASSATAAVEGGAGGIGEGSQASHRYTDLCTVCSLTSKSLWVLPLTQQLDQCAQRLETFIYELAVTYYQQRVQRVASSRELVQRAQLPHQPLVVRHCFKLAFFHEIKLDITDAYRWYQQAYSRLLEMCTPAGPTSSSGGGGVCGVTDWELLGVAAVISYKLCQLAFVQNLARDAVRHFRRHVEAMAGAQLLRLGERAGVAQARQAEAMLAQVDVLEAPMFGWISQQYCWFGELFEHAVTHLSLAPIHSQNPAIYYEMAAGHARVRKLLVAGKTHAERTDDDYPSPDPLSAQLHLAFIGQQPWRRVTPSLPAAAAAADHEASSSGDRQRALRSAVFVLERSGAEDRHALIVRLLSAAVEQYRRLAASERAAARLLARLAAEFADAGDHHKAVVLWLRALEVYQSEMWWSVLLPCVLACGDSACRCAHAAGLLAVCAVLCSSQAPVAAAVKTTAAANFHKLLLRQVPDTSLSLAQQTTDKNDEKAATTACSAAEEENGSNNAAAWQSALTPASFSTTQLNMSGGCGDLLLTADAFLAPHPSDGGGDGAGGGSATVGEPFYVHVHVRNTGGRPLRVLWARAALSGGLTAVGDVRHDASVELTYGDDHGAARCLRLATPPLPASAAHQVLSVRSWTVCVTAAAADAAACDESGAVVTCHWRTQSTGVVAAPALCPLSRDRVLYESGDTSSPDACVCRISDASLHTVAMVQPRPVYVTLQLTHPRCPSPPLVGELFPLSVCLVPRSPDGASGASFVVDSVTLTILPQISASTASAAVSKQAETDLIEQSNVMVVYGDCVRPLTSTGVTISCDQQTRTNVSAADHVTLTPAVSLQFLSVTCPPLQVCVQYNEVTELGSYPVRLSETLNLTAVHPFQVEVSMLNERLSVVDRVTPGHTVFVTCEVTSTCPHAIQLHDTQLEVDETMFQDVCRVSHNSGQQSATAAAAPFDDCQLRTLGESAVDCWSASVQPRCADGGAASRPTALTIRWARVAENEAGGESEEPFYVSTVATVSSVCVASVVPCVSVRLLMASRGCLHQPASATYRLINESRRVRHLVANLESRDCFMVAGDQQKTFYLSPGEVYDLQYALYPLACGRVRLPRLRLAAVGGATGGGGTENERLDRLQVNTALSHELQLLPRYLYVLPSAITDGDSTSDDQLASLCVS